MMSSQRCWKCLKSKKRQNTNFVWGKIIPLVRKNQKFKSGNIFGPSTHSHFRAEVELSFKYMKSRVWHQGWTELSWTTYWERSWIVGLTSPIFFSKSQWLCIYCLPIGDKDILKTFLWKFFSFGFFFLFSHLQKLAWWVIKDFVGLAENYLLRD